jgi:hypothetical protein
MMSNQMNLTSCAVFAGVLLVLPMTSVSAQSPVDVLTYHGDNFRTGWFSAETMLTASNVTPETFGLLQTVTLDGRVDAEPLFVTEQAIAGEGIHNVVYVATEQNTVYAIDAENGTILWKRSLGTPVQRRQCLPGDGHFEHASD